MSEKQIRAAVSSLEVQTFRCPPKLEVIEDMFVMIDSHNACQTMLKVHLHSAKSDKIKFYLLCCCCCCSQHYVHAERKSRV